MTDRRGGLPEVEDDLAAVPGLDDRLQRLMALSRTVSTSLDVGEALRAVTRAVTDITSPSIVSLWAADEGTGTLTSVGRWFPGIHLG